MTATPSRRGQSLKISSRKKKTKFKHNATKVVSTGRRTTKTVYWDQRSGSWKSTKNKPIGDGLKRDFSKTSYKTRKNYELKKKNVNEESEKKSKIIDKARRQGTAPKFGDLRGSNTKIKSDNNKPNKEDKPTTESKAKTNELKDKTVEETITENNKENKVEKKEVKKDPLANYRRGKGTKLGKDTRITKKLKKAGFTEDRLAKLRKKNAAFQKAKKGGKEAMKKYRAIYG